MNGSDLSSLLVTPPLPNTIPLSNIYTNIPYKHYQIYVDGNRINISSPMTLALINQALRNSWSSANSNLFSPDDLSVPSITPTLAQ